MGYSIELQLLKTLEQKFNFRSNLIDHKHDWGVRVNESWTSAIGSVQINLSQFGICAIVQSYERSKVVDFSNFIIQNEVVFISQSPSIDNRNWLAVQPFQTSLWLSIILTILIVNVFLAILKFSKNGAILCLIAVYLKQCK